MSIMRRTIVLLALACAAAAHSAELTATLDTANLRLRKDGPIPIEVRFQNPTQRLLEGRLEFTLLLGDRTAGVHRTAELFLQPGAQTVPVLLPPPADVPPGDGIAAHLRWLGSDGARNIGDQHIGIYGGSTGFVLGIIRSGRGLAELDHARDKSLKLESLRPTTDLGGWLGFSTQQAPIAVSSLPVHPAGLCAYDAVFLDGPSFAAANAKQLAALARWVDAGGSVGICAVARIEDRHIAFLDRLGASELPPVRFTTDPNGALTRGAGAPILLRPGLGRAFVAVDPGSTPKAFERNEWRAAVGWLWRLRESEQHEVATTGTWSKDFLRQHRGRGGPDGYVLSSIWGAAAGFDELTPGAPRRMPLGVVALVLGALLLVAGPVDWFALGWLRRRRWTWFAFPIACAACAWWTAHLAGRYLGIEDRSGRIRFVDMGADGRPLREVRYEMLLPARDREWVFDVRDGIAVPVPRSDSTGNPWARSAASSPGQPAAQGDSSAWTSPGHFTLRRTLQQWTPAMVRITSFPEATEGAQPDWNGALAYFAANKTAESWNPGVASASGFRFEIPHRDGRDVESYSPGYVRATGRQFRHEGREAESSAVDSSFARWVAFGNDWRIAGGLGAATSPVLAGTSDLVHGRDWSPDSRALCAWRRAGGELLIYRRSVPVK